MRSFLTVLILLPALASAQFSPRQREAARRYWSGPVYETAVPKEAAKEGRWVARATPEGSTFHWTIRKGTFKPDSEAAAWIARRVEYDWAMARNDAAVRSAQADARFITKALEILPPNPGPAPLGLTRVPERFAVAVQPADHVVKFPDAEYRFTDNVKVGDARYPYYRTPQGVRRFGAPTAKKSEAELKDLAGRARIGDPGLRVMRAVSGLEGGFDSINTYDTGIVSVGFIQFACLGEGKGSLARVLAATREIDADAFDKDFATYGVSLAPDGCLAAIDPTTGTESTGAAAALTIARSPRLAAVFVRAGERCPAFLAAQIRTAYEMYHPANEVVAISNGVLELRFRVGEIIRSEAGMATLMDRKVQTGKLGALNEIVTAVAAEYGLTSLDAISLYEREIVRRMKHRKDFLLDTTLSQPPTLPSGT